MMKHTLLFQFEDHLVAVDQGQAVGAVLGAEESGLVLSFIQSIPSNPLLLLNDVAPAFALDLAKLTSEIWCAGEPMLLTEAVNRALPRCPGLLAWLEGER